jgi:hypothetical protein
VITLDRSVATRAILVGLFGLGAASLVGRFGLGAASLILPRFTARLPQMDPDANPASSFLMRLFGARDIFLGVRRSWFPGTVAAESSPQRQGLT